MSTKRSNPATKRANKPKRAKLSAPTEVALGEAAQREIEKADDELALEEAVFGTSRGGKTSVWDQELAAGDQAEDEDEFVETGLERLEDDNVSRRRLRLERGHHRRGGDHLLKRTVLTIRLLFVVYQLFFLDVPEASTSAFPPSDSEAGSEAEQPPPKASTSKAVVKPRNGRQPAWFDPADQDLTVSLADTTRLRKLRDARDENTVTGLEYETRLRRQ